MRSAGAPDVAATGRIAGAAALIAVLTVASRLAGFARTGTFTWVVGNTDLGDIYLAANTVPNIIFEIVAGGALASLVVPLLAGSVDKGDRAAVSATTSALLTWTTSLLLPLAALVALLAGPIVSVLYPGGSPEQLEAGERMLRVFAPQLPLYGIGIVLTGVLQAHRRFAWPVIAPLLSSVTVIGAYVTFGAVEGRRAGLGQVGLTGEMILAVGTTLGVVVLSSCLLIPVRTLGLRPRPTYHFPVEARRDVGGLALAGAVTVGAQQVAILVALRLSSGGPEGTYVEYNLAQTIYLLPWAVLAVPLATAAYPALAAARDDERRYRETLAPAVRGILLLSCLGAAALVAVAGPVARFFQVPAAEQGIAGFAPGLVGYGMFAVLTRAMYARGEPGPAAAATAAGWGCAALAAIGLAAGLADERRVLALTLGNSIGMVVLGALLVAVLVRRAGRTALAGLSRAALVGVLAGGAAAVAGWLVTRATGTPTDGGAVLQGMLSGAVVAAVFAGVAYPLDRHDVRPMMRAALRGRRS